MPGFAASPKAGLDMQAVEQLNNPNDINKLLHESLATERTIDAGLDQLLGRRGQLQDELVSLTSFSGEVFEVVQVDAEQLLQSVQRTAAVAEEISSRVKELDLAQSNVKDVIKDIHVIIDRTSCVSRLQHALSKNNYEEAAHCIGEFRGLQQQLDLGEDAHQLQIVDESEAQLEEIVKTRFNSAIDDRQHEDVARFVKLFKPLNKKDEGLRRYLEYMKGTVGTQGRQTYQQLSHDLEGTSPDKADIVGALTKTFKCIALTVEENEEVLKSTFGTDAVLEAITALQHECDTHGARIIQRYLEARKVSRIVKEIGLQKHKDIGMVASSSSFVDPRGVEDYLQELLHLCQRSEEYNRFMLNKMAELVAPNPLSPIRETSFRGGQLNVNVRELLGYYIALEEYYMEENVKKAIEIDEQMHESLTTSMVDDVFFILRKCSTRAMVTSNLQCVCSVLGLMNSMISQHLVEALRKKLVQGPSKFLASAIAPSETEKPEDVGFPTYLNDAEVCAGYVTKLKSELDQYVGSAFAATKDRAVAQSVLSDVMRTTGEFQTLTTRGIDQLCDGIIPKLKTALDEAANSTYELSDSEYTTNELRDTWVRQLLDETNKITVWLTSVLTPNNLDAVLHLLLDRLASRIEAVMLRKKFNQLGGLQLDRDVRALVSHLSESSQRTVRDKFSRLTQIATVVCLESVEEMLDYWGDDSGGITWRLTPGEIKSAMRLRVDFTDAKIAALVL